MKQQAPDDLFEINPLDLDGEYVRFPRNYAKAARELAEATDDYERAKAALKAVTSELDYAIRSNPEGYGITKVTDAVVAQALVRQKRYHTSHDEMLTAKRAMELAQAVVDTFDHHRWCIDGAARLWVAGYFSTDMKPPKTMPEERRDEIRRKELDHSLKSRVKVRRGE